MIWLFYLAVALFLLFLLYLVWIWKAGKKWSEQDRKYFRISWEKIMNLPDHRLKLMEVDKLLDHLMNKKGYTGNLGDKLKKHQALFTDLNGLWTAHKLRNRMAHEMDARIAPQEVEKALKSFKRAFNDLGLDEKK
jgi:Ca2+/Na+ antiporter